MKCWCLKKREKTDMVIPNLFQNYNKSMDGIDEIDQTISLYRIVVHGMKWWWVLFTYMLDMTISNAWRLHVMNSESLMDQILFRQGGQNKSRQSGLIVEGFPQVGISNYRPKIEKQLRCIICHA